MLLSAMATVVIRARPRMYLSRSGRGLVNWSPSPWYNIESESRAGVTRRRTAERRAEDTTATIPSLIYL